MINLLPPDIKSMRLYGRRNITLLRWSSFCLAAMVGLTVIVAGGYIYITQAEKSAEKSKAQTEESIKLAKLDDVEKQYASFSSNLKTVTQILSKQVLFSDLIQKIGSVIPSGVTLNGVSLTDTDNALNLDFKVANPGLAATLQVNLEDQKNELFEKADLLNVACSPDATTKLQVCTVQVRALYRKDAKFLFLNSVSSGATK